MARVEEKNFEARKIINLGIMKKLAGVPAESKIPVDRIGIITGTHLATLNVLAKPQDRSKS